jgi:pSer/pThr/pTyr-binding forkhead associated (FHA) protein
MEIKEIASLVLEGDSYDQDPIPLSPSGITSIGRLLDNDVVISEVGVSRFHSEIIETEGGYYLRDMGSTNGTFLNECRLAEGNQELQDGDTINLGNKRVSLTFRCPKAETVQFELDENGDDIDRSPTWMGEAISAGAASTEAILAEYEQAKDLYEGTARLNVLKVSGSMKQVVEFANHLSETEDFRVLRMARTVSDGVDIWVALRQPILLQETLSEFTGVEKVSPTRGRDLSIQSSDPPLTVMLKLGPEAQRSLEAVYKAN